MLHMRDGVLRREGCFSAVRCLFLVLILLVIIITALVLEVGGPLVFMRLSILGQCQQKFRQTAKKYKTHVLIPPQCFMDVSRGKLA